MIANAPSYGFSTETGYEYSVTTVTGSSRAASCTMATQAKPNPPINHGFSIAASNGCHARAQADPLCAISQRNCHAVNSSGSAISNGVRNPSLANGVAEMLGLSVESTMAAPSACSSKPKARGIQRAWRPPTQNAPAPSSAQAALVHLASSASGIASVTKPSPIAAIDSAIKPMPSRRRRIAQAASAR